MRYTESIYTEPTEGGRPKTRFYSSSVVKRLPGMCQGPDPIHTTTRKRKEKKRKAGGKEGAEARKLSMLKILKNVFNKETALANRVWLEGRQSQRVPQCGSWVS